MSKRLEEIMKKAYETGALTDTEFRKAITDLFLEEDEYIIDTGNFENVNAEFVLRLKGKHRKLHKIFWNDKFAKEPTSTKLLMQELGCKDFADLRKYARCGHEKLNKHYLKWEDLEFDNNAQVKKYLKVKLGDNIYSAFYYYSFFMDCEMFCIARDTLSLYITDKQFFNDLHLERVEE